MVLRLHYPQPGRALTASVATGGCSVAAPASSLSTRDMSSIDRVRAAPVEWSMTGWSQTHHNVLGSGNLHSELRLPNSLS
jgi:hypothetical protein